VQILTDIVTWFLDPIHWQGTDGIPSRLLEHLYYSITATLAAALVALPIGLVLGHLNRGAVAVLQASNMGRAIATIGVVVIVFQLFGLSDTPVLVALFALAVPPMVTNSYIGVRTVEREVVEAAKGMGMTGTQVLWRVELPVALPLVMAGVRTSSVQVVATATIAAYVGLGGLGRFLFDGLAIRDLPQITAGAVLVALLSVTVELALGRLQTLVVSKGLVQRNAEAAVQAKLQAPAR
jgi:osmoprotectant transport system permease protein